MEFENYNGCIDIPDDRDITVEELDLLGSAQYPESMLHANTPILNQGSIWACTVFGLSGATFESTYLDAVENGSVYNQPFDPWKVWERAKERGATDTGWWSLQGALQLALDMWLIAGYAKLAGPWQITFDKIASSISKNRLIYTGSARGNWRAIERTHVYEEGTVFAGHAYCITGYRPGQSINRNSWAEVWWDKGHFYTNDEDFKKYYSTYVILDPSDVDRMKDIRNARAKKHSDLSLSRGVWNGSRPNDIASDEEIRIMLGRALNIMGARTREYWSTTFEEKVLRGKWLVNIWNEKDGKRNATDGEIAAMFSRAVKRDPKISSKVLTRFQVSAVIGRDFLV